MSDILEEILNEDRDSKRVNTFRKVLPAIIISTVIVACAIAGYGWFSASKTNQHKELGDLFIQSFVSENANKNKKIVNNILQELKNNRDSKLFELATIEIVSKQIQSGDVVKAMNSLEEIVGSGDYSEIAKSYARILYITIVLDVEKLTSDQENKTREYLQYFTKESQLFYPTATLLKALFYFKNQQFDLSKEHALEILKLSRASAIVKDQAKAIISNIDMRVGG